MPLSARPPGPIAPVDLLWRHELREHNIALLHRMNALEAKFTDQERRVQVAEEAAATCSIIGGELDLIKHGVDQLEERQQQFISGVHKRLVDMDKDIEEFKKTQERVQKLMTTQRRLDDNVAGLSMLHPRIESAQKEIQGLKNSVEHKYAHEMEDVHARLETLEIYKSREAAEIKAVQEDFVKKFSGDFKALRTQVARLTEPVMPAEAQLPYLQVPNSPDIATRATNMAVRRDDALNIPAVMTTDMDPLQQQRARNGPPRAQQPLRGTEMEEATQSSAPARNIEDLDLDAAFAPHVPRAPLQTLPPNPIAKKKPQPSRSNVQKKKVQAKQPQTQPRQQGKTGSDNQSKAQRAGQARPNQDDYLQQSGIPDSASILQPQPAPSMTVKLPININKKRPGSPIAAPRPAKEPLIAPGPRQIHRAPKAQPKPREKQPQPSQPARRSRRRSANATFYELGWDATQQLQSTVGPVYGSNAKSAKPLKTKPRRLPPVPDE